MEALEGRGGNIKTLAEKIAEYGAYHRDSRNRLTHFFGVPMIIFGMLIPLSWLTVDVIHARVSVALALVLIVLVYYLWLDTGLALATALIFFVLLTIANVVASECSTSVGWMLFGFFFGGGWALQFIGHAFEGRKPAFFDNILQVFTAPIFLVAELFFAFGLRRELKREARGDNPQRQ